MTTPDNYHRPDETAHTQQARLTDWTWEGSSVVELTGKVSELFPHVPVFSRHPFRIGNDENRFKDEVRREPLKITDEPMPVATVSKTYSLIQHRDVLGSVFRALKMIHIDISGVESSLLLSEYAERMQWSCAIPNIDFDPGDGHPLVLRINCLNSVDTSTVLEVTLNWFRLICSNGMMFGLKDNRLRRRHIQSLDPEDIAAYLKEQLDQVPQEKSSYLTWFKTEVEPSSLITWIDGPVAKEWGPHAAARVWNIINEGFDGEVEQARALKPHKLPITSRNVVPGERAPPQESSSPSGMASIADGELGAQHRSQHGAVVRANPEREAPPGDGLPLLSRHHSLGAAVLPATHGSRGRTGPARPGVPLSEREVDLEELARRGSLIPAATRLPTPDS